MPVKIQFPERRRELLVEVARVQVRAVEAPTFIQSQWLPARSREAVDPRQLLTSRRRAAAASRCI